MARSTRLSKERPNFKNFFSKSFNKHGEKWHLISTEWLAKLKERDTESGFSEPIPIDNQHLFEDGTQKLKSGLLEDRDYKLISEDDWDQIIDCYGIVNPYHDVIRKVVDINLNKEANKPNLILDLYPIKLKLVKYPVTQQINVKSYLKYDQISKIEEDMRTIFQVPVDMKIRLWKTDNLSNLNSYTPLPDKTMNLFDAGLINQFIVMECENKSRGMPTWPLTSKSTTTNQYEMQFSAYEEDHADTPESSSDEDKNIIRSAATNNNTNIGTNNSPPTSHNNFLSSFDNRSVVPGLSGCINLGNTCFMNSAIQCLSNVPPLTEYFISKKFLQDINVNNPLGMKGMIAKAYAKLMECIWCNKNCSSTLRAFKDIVGEFAPTFSGYQQHDSQELLIFLLDGLHEDLNRVKKKPYIEVKEAEGRKDEEVSRESWQHFKLRNDSIIVDTFYGQLKSTLVCPVCSKVSVTFDPFSTLSVPLPYKKERAIKAKIVPYDPDRKPIHCRINVPKNGTIADLCNIVSSLTGIPINHILVSKIALNRFHKVFNIQESISMINPNDDIVIYEVPMTPDKGLILPFYQELDKRLLPNDAQQSIMNTQINSASFFVPPFIIAAPANKTNEGSIRKLLMEKMRRFVVQPDPSNEWWNLRPKIPEKEKSYLKRHPPPMFTIRVGNIYGNPDYTLVEPDELEHIKKAQSRVAEQTSEADQTLPLSCEKFGAKIEPCSFLILDWDPIAKAKFFDTEAALRVIVHESLNTSTSFQTNVDGNASSTNFFNNNNNDAAAVGIPLGSTGKQGVTTLTDCLNTFVSTERLSEEDSWYCPSCKKHQQATKKFDLWRLPPILIVHLKRFYYNRFFREKINIPVSFPINNLDISNYVKNSEEKNCVYNLMAVSNHYGELGYGHYTAFAKNYFNKQWYNFDDSHVAPVKETDVKGPAAYVLFYQRAGTEHLFFSPSSISSQTYSTFDSMFTSAQLAANATSQQASGSGRPSHHGIFTRSSVGMDSQRPGGNVEINQIGDNDKAELTSSFVQTVQKKPMESEQEDSGVLNLMEESDSDQGLDTSSDLTDNHCCGNNADNNKNILNLDDNTDEEFMRDLSSPSGSSNMSDIGNIDQDNNKFLFADCPKIDPKPNLMLSPEQKHTGKEVCCDELPTRQPYKKWESFEHLADDEPLSTVLITQSAPKKHRLQKTPSHTLKTVNNVAD